MSLKIAMLAPFEEPVPPVKYGGTEAVVANLISELVRMGHDVTLFGTGDSHPPCHLIPIFPTGLRTTPPYSTDSKTREMAKTLGIGKVLRILQSDRYDIVHNHIGWRFNMFSHLLSAPVVTTLHGPGGIGYQKMIHMEYPTERFISISNNQRLSFPELNYIKTVYNGIDIDPYAYKEKPDDDYLFFLARFSPEKGAKEAIEIAKKSGKRLLMATKIDTVDQAYYESVKPLIDGEQIKLIGEIDLATKVHYLQNATALLAPIQWEEPFGLYVVEAMACGTPTIGTSRGSFPELVTHGKDGFLGKTVDDMAGFVKEIPTISRRVCRETVENRFTKAHMSAGYMEAYESILRG